MAFLFLFFTVVLSLCVVGLIVLALSSILASVRDDWRLKKPKREPRPGEPDSTKGIMNSLVLRLTTLSPFFIVTSLRTWSPSSRSLFVSLNFFGLPMRFLDYDTRAEAFDAAG